MRGKKVGSEWYSIITEEKLRFLYVRRQWTIKEIADSLGVSITPVQTAMRKYGIPGRNHTDKQKGRRDGAENHQWKGNNASYKALHNRVYRTRGAPCLCSECGTTDPNKRYDWHNPTKEYHRLFKYFRLCRSCHNRATQSKS